MSRLKVRRLTAGLILAVLLCAAPAAAAPPSWSLSPSGHGPGWLDHVFAWIGSLFLGGEAQGQATREKDGGSASSTPDAGTSQPEAPLSEHSGVLDPNG